MTPTTKQWRSSRPVAAAFALAALTACENTPEFLKAKPTTEQEAPVLAGGSLTLQERDVEAPDVFNVIDDAIWDGRPSFGGVWVAYPGNTQPERVNIRNVSNGKSVVGALFKREAENPGPPIALSSDAAEALGIIAGTPTKLTITALRREPIEVVSVENETPAIEVLSETVLAPVGSTAGPAPQGTEEIALTVEEALGQVSDEETGTATSPATTEDATAAAQATATKAPTQRPKSALIQVGTFSSEKNAAELVSKLRSEDLPASSQRQTSSSGKVLYRVIAGPAESPNDLTQFLTKIKGLGFTDAFVVSK